ncbi:42045_t:CDS:2, partial [Gigaspora margarita]
KELDILIIDSEGMGSTASKYISRRTDFDKKMTLLGLMCSQILIVNTKGLTRDISDTLEVSSYHLDALSNRDSNKPRISFVLCDMKDAKEAQHPAFLDIRENLKKMFDEIPGCSNNMDDFMIVEEKDVHLLENAFACSFDDFYPQTMIVSAKNFHYPAETFPLKISKLREEILDSALIPSENHESQIFKNVHGFITHMQAVWKEIDAHGNFLHFKDSKTIQQWKATMNLVHKYYENNIKPYEESVLNWIEEQTSEGQWNEDNDTAFETYLTQESEKRCTETIADFKNKINNQYEPYIIDEGETYIKRAFTDEKQKLKTSYTLRQQHSKESYLIRSARMRIGKTVGKIHEDHKDKSPYEFKKFFSESKREELFNEEWEKVEDDNNKFMRAMTKETKDLEKHVVDIVNQAIKSGREFLNDIDKQFIKITNRNDLVKVLNIFIKNNTEQSSVKNEVMGRIKTVIEDTCKNICDGLLSQNALTIEFNQALEWLKRLCNNIFIEQDHFNNSPGQNYNVKIEDFSLIEQYLRFKVFITLEDSTKKWKDSQQNNLNDLRENLLKSFNNLLNNFSYENISSQFFKTVAKSVEKQIFIQEKYILQVFEKYLNKKWMIEKRNPTRYAYEQSFGSYDIEKTRKYINNPTSFMKELFEKDIDIFKDIKVEERVEEIEKTVKNALEKLESLIRDAILVLGKCFIGSPQNFLNALEGEYDKYVKEFNTLWKTVREDHCRKSLKNCIESSKSSYWDKVKGCRHRCPYCGSKCELPEHEPNTNHKASIHFMICFNGFCKRHTKKASLMICNEPENFDQYYYKEGANENGIIFEEYTKKYHQEWWPLLERKEPNDDQITQIRAMWMNLKDELCKKFKMIDDMPINWKDDYDHLAK